MSVPSPAMLDTSVVIDLDRIPAEALPAEQAICAITLAELAAGPYATDDRDERARRQDRLQRIEALMDPLPFDADAARAYGRVYAATCSASRKPRRSRAVDLMIAAVALSRSLPLVTRNPSDFADLAGLGLRVYEI